jgi:hypothetical protein
VSSPTNYTRLKVNGDISLGGTLSTGFGADPEVFSVGAEMDFLDWTGTLTGGFDKLELPELPETRVWNASQLYVNGIISVERMLAADFNEDYSVDVFDLGVWRANFGATGITAEQGDADLDGDADGMDFLIWQQEYGSFVVAATPAPVPEPAGWASLLLGAPAIIEMMKRRANAAVLAGSLLGTTHRVADRSAVAACV